ncbi:Copper amine oxidase N-terminal domain-containing protein [Paenibacillaceae bacterium GAS479]|nr:Copper amine oxidase N-terminal domain-containing protein [Paenibacillaceae bacterium GAS479]
MLCLLMVVAAGCQSVGGLELNSMISKALKAETKESRGSIALNVDFAPEAYEGMTDRERQQMDLLRDLRLRIDSAKVESATRGSVNGALLIGGKGIGFSIQQDELKAVMRVDGLKRPIVLSLDEAALLNLGSDVASGASLEDLASEASGLVVSEESAGATAAQQAEFGRKLVDRVGGYLISNLPNATQLDVKPVSEDVYGGGKAMWQVDAGWNGMEMFDWAHAYVKALLADSQGLNVMLDGLFEALQEHPEMNAFNEDGEPLQDAEKESFIADGKETLNEILQDAADSMQEAREEGGLEELFTPASALKVHLLLDGSLDIRKLDASLTWQPGPAMAEEDEFPIRSVSLRVQMDSWNVDGPVRADRPEVASDSWDLSRWMESGSSRLLRDFDKNSDGYKLLKNELHAGRQSATFYSDGYQSLISMPSGQTLVPLRSLASSLDASVTYDGARKKWKIYDEAKGNTIWIATGSKVAYVGGVKSQLSFPPTVVDGTLFVPARDFAKLLKASVSVEKDSYYYSVEIAREVG